MLTTARQTVTRRANRNAQHWQAIAATPNRNRGSQPQKCTTKPAIWDIIAKCATPHSCVATHSASRHGKPRQLCADVSIVMDVAFVSDAPSAVLSLLSRSSAWSALPVAPSNVFKSSDAGAFAVSRPSDAGKAVPHAHKARARLGIGASAPRDTKPEEDILKKRMSKDQLRRQRKVLEETEAAVRRVDSDDDDGDRYGGYAPR